MAPTATIIITCFNRQKYVGDAILSAVNQDTSKPIEIIIVDDASDDESREVIKKFVDNYHNIRSFYHYNNKGLLEATLTGLKNSAGQYIFLLDSDDILDSNTVETCLSFFERNRSIALIVYNSADIDEAESFPVKNRMSPSSINARYGGEERFFDAQSEYVRAATYSAFDKTKTRLDAFIKKTEDFMQISGMRRANQVTPMVTWAQAINPNGIYWYPEVLYYRRIHSGNSGSAPNLVKFVSNYERAENSLRIAEHLSKNSLPKLQRKILESKLSEVLIIKHALDARYLLALKGLLKITNSRVLSTRPVLKIWAKTLLLLFLGPRSYFVIKNRAMTWRIR